MRRGFVCAVLLWGVFANAAHAEFRSFESRWAEATRSGHKIIERPDMTIVATDEGRTYWYFSKPGHPAHQGIVKMAVTRGEDGKWATSINAFGFESPAPPPVYQAWISEIIALDRENRPQTGR